MKILKNASFKTKLIMLCLFMSAVSITLGSIAYRALHQVESSYEHITTEVMPKLQAANEMFVTFRQIRISLRTLGLSGITKEQEEQSVSNAVEAIDEYEKVEATYRSLAFISGQKELYAEVHSSWLNFKIVGEKILSLQKSERLQDKEEMSKLFFKDCPETAKTYAQAMAKFTAVRFKFIN